MERLNYYLTPSQSTIQKIAKNESIDIQKLLSYEKGVDFLIENNDSTIHYNRDIEYSMIVISKLFDVAREEVNVLNGNFNSLICNNNPNNFLTKLERFLILGGKINVLLTKYSETENNQTINLLKQFASDKFYKGKINVKHMKKCPINANGEEFHFTVADEKAFREEYDIKQFSAKFSFNNPIESKRLNQIFFQYFNTTQAIKII